MGKKKSPFTKENSVTFRLVHRSQQDPLVADETAPQNVLIQSTRGKRKQPNKEEQIKYGIYYDDDYDYLQHLKDADDVPKPTVDWEPVSKNKKKDKIPQIMLPSSVFASDVQEKDGLLNRAALPTGPQPNWDPDIVAAMEEDFDFDNPDNQLEDDFFAKMMGADGGVQDADAVQEQDGSDDEDEYEDVDDSDDDTVVSDESGGRFSDEETKSCFTNYSMTSSVMRRNKGLTSLDDQFEALFEREYADDTDIGPLNEGDEDGYIDVNKSEIIKKIIGDKKEEEKDRIYVNQMIGQRFGYQEIGHETTVDIEVDDLEKQQEPEYDCQSIISTYSNLYNHPKIIYEKVSRKVKIDPKTGIPVLPKPGLTAENLKEMDMKDENAYDGCGKSVRTTVSRVSELSIRDKNETPEERRARKEALKEYRRERRLEKKANKMVFKLEEKRQVKEVINLQQNLSAVKLC